MLALIKNDISFELIVGRLRVPRFEWCIFPRTTLRHRAGYPQNHYSAILPDEGHPYMGVDYGSDNHMFGKMVEGHRQTDLFSCSSFSVGAFHRLLRNTWIKLLSTLRSLVGCSPPRSRMALVGADRRRSGRRSVHLRTGAQTSEASMVAPQALAKGSNGAWPHTEQRKCSTRCGSRAG